MHDKIEWQTTVTKMQANDQLGIHRKEHEMKREMGDDKGNFVITYFDF